MKNLARLLALVLVVVMALSLVGCGLNSKLKGEWVGEVMGIEMTLEFDGKGEVTTSVMGEEETTEYEVDGKKLIIDGDEVDYELKGKTLTLDLDGIKVEFEKQ